MLKMDLFCNVEGNKGKGLEIEIKEGKVVKSKELENHWALKACGEEDTITALFEATTTPFTLNNLFEAIGGSTI
ncbi:hypothetical protein BGX30_011824 [Mortierella sp. GBA39]|nr:hypothetical protein BGX30_011824 [Mortierella sp. GBA39]